MGWFRHKEDPPYVAALADFSGAELWDASGEVLRFACSWDTTDEDVARLVAGVATALTFAR